MEISDNPLLDWGTLPRFGAITPAHVAPAVHATLERCQRDLTALEAAIESQDAADAEALIADLERLEDRLDWTWTLANHLNAVRTSDALRAAIEGVQAEVVAFQARIAQSEPLYRAFERLRSDEGFSERPAAVRRVITLALRAAQHAGVGLEGEARAEFNRRRQELAHLGLEFGNHLLDATKAYSLLLTTPSEVAGLSDRLRALAAHGARLAGHDTATAEAGPWRITLDHPSFVPFLEQSTRRELREQVFRAYVTRASSGELDNGPLIARILALRREQARALGFDTYAELSIDAKMAPSVEAARALLAELHHASWPAARVELAELTEFARERGGPAELALWDVPYWARRLRQHRFAYSDEELRPYFSLPSVLQGLFALAERLFGIRVSERAGVDTWHPDVRYFDVRDASEDAPIAGFFLDPYSRPEDKRGGAWMNECVTRSRYADGVPADGGARRPVAYLVCNGAPPLDGAPSLLTFREAETLFHEFGHGLQHMLTEVDRGAVAGIRGVEWDAVELPSQFMENWLRHRPTLLSFARHYQTGEAMPDALADRLLASQTFRAGSSFLRQLYFSELDLALHHDYDPDGERTIADVKAAVAARSTVIPPLPEDRFLCAFSHLFGGGYAAGYYSYKWAEVLSADAFSAFEEAGLDDEAAVAEVGRRFRATVLALGGSVEPGEVFRAFRGRGPSTRPLLRHNGLLPDGDRPSDGRIAKLPLSPR